ncbi:OPT family oligopeptide transporter [Telluribacter sp.]|jgi:putative OPT family oligopeptide transporter|uniref:OPT family oligopeptide transporter n=1 Tax=Telluribacter sp. TaxID=1978767 RepID=UPI002E1519F7|nr:oligopeptide transporter, OPT family [Telluribacter sp.]
MTKNPFLANFRPYIADTVKNMRELTPVPLLVGTLLGVIFGISSLYLVLKVGLTVSASIPVAVISITLFRLLSRLGLRDITILEHNIVQTAGSAGESIAFGVGVTMPAILILGFDLEIWRVTLVAVLGGLLGILMMIPLRRAMIREQHGFLKYPEGTACAEVLKAGANQESRRASIEAETAVTDSSISSGGKTIGAGFGLGFLFVTLMQVFKGWKEVPGKEFGPPFQGGSISLENNPALLGVGYIIGPRIAGVMFAGGALAYLVLIPMIAYFGGGLGQPLTPATAKLISDMALEGKDSIQSTYILYIGAGAVAAGGIISLFRSFPMIFGGIRSGIRDFRSGDKVAVKEALPRTDQDISMKWVIGGILALTVILALVPALKMNIMGAVFVILFGFLFVTVSSRLTGEIGSSSNPISGMTVATLLLTCLAFLLLGWTQPDPYFVTALSIGGIVCIASSNGGTTSQDLKTGFHVGSTPWKQQVAILVGALVSALALGPVLIGLNEASTVYVPVAPAAFATEFRVPDSQLLRLGDEPKREGVKDERLNDEASYFVWHNTDVARGEAGRYLVDEAGKPAYLVDPGINGTITERADGTSITKYYAPKATLMSYIIKGILSQELPWNLVLLGVMIAIVLELAGIPSLAFAVGLYLPIAVSAPIFVGGLVRWLVDKEVVKGLRGRNLKEEEIIAETDKSPGVLLASGYIAGGALAGIMVALAAEFLSGTVLTFTNWSEANNPFFAGANADWLALLPFGLLAVLLYLTGRSLLLAGKPATEVPR